MYACNGILFNHGSPRRGLDFFERKLSHNVAKIKLKQVNKIKFGNLDASRDLGSAEDYIVAMNMMLDFERPEEFVISTGSTYKMSDMVKIMFEIANIKNYEEFLETDESLMRPSEVPVLLGDSSKAINTLKWKPTKSIYNLFEDMYKNDLNLLKK